MLTELRIQNFKGWKDTGKIRLAPITVLFGTNSSGKSSIGQFLMMLKQTAASPDRSRVLHPGDTQTPVDLGTFEDVMHGHDLAKSLQFSMTWQLPKKLSVIDVLSDGKSKCDGNQIRFEGDIGFQDGKVKKAVCNQFSYELLLNESPSLKLAMSSKDAVGEYQLHADGMKLVRRPGRVWPLPAPTRFFGFPDQMVNYYQNADSLSDLALAMQEMLGKLSYLGPLREEPKRGYTWTGETPEEVGRRGEAWVSAFLAASGRRLSLGYKKRAIGYDVLIAQRLKQLGVIHSFEVKELVSGQRDYRVHLQIGANSPVVAIPDVGFGVSQVLPVVVQAFYAPIDSTVIIEQPELHLHPGVQQNLADLFVDGIHAQESGARRNVQYIIESHSEHFLRRMQRRVAEGVLSHAEIAVYFCQSEGGRSRLVPLEMDEDANIKNWPKEFFGDQMTDIAEKQLAALRRRQNEGGGV